MHHNLTILATLLFVHLVASVGAGFYLASRFPADRRQARVWKWLGIIFAFFMPVYGLLGIFSIYLLLRRKHESKGSYRPVSTFDEHLRKDRLSAKTMMRTFIDVNWREEKEIQPLVDALKAVDVNLRKGAVDALAEKRNPEAIKLLAESLDNTVLEVRYHAVEALERISKSYGDRIMEAQEMLEETPNAYESIMALGDRYYDYATSAVEDVMLSEYYLYQAFNQYTKAIEIDDSDAELLVRYGDILNRLGRDEEALKSYRNALGRDEDQRVDALVGLADVCLKMGRIKEVREIAQRLETATSVTPEVLSATAMWRDSSSRP